MRALLYVLSICGLAVGGLGLSLLARFAPTLWVFGLGGAVLTGMIAGAWVTLSATADTWPRPRTGQILMITGLLGAAVNEFGGKTLAALWSALVFVAGAALIFPLWPARHRAERRRRIRGPVRPPLGRREEM